MTTIALNAFATAVKNAIARVPESGRFGSRKVFVSSVWDALPEIDRARQNLDAFKAQLLQAQRRCAAGLVATSCWFLAMHRSSNQSSSRRSRFRAVEACHDYAAHRYHDVRCDQSGRARYCKFESAAAS